MREVGVLIACLLLALPACGPERSGPPPAAPRAAEPADVIPGDLDLVIRISIARIRAALGPALVDAWRSKAAFDSGDEELFAASLERADTVWIAARDLGLVDNVIVMRGDFTGIDPRNPNASRAWEIPSDLGGGWRMFERKKPPTRAAPARLYMHGDKLLVFVSTAEIDAIERRFEGRSSSANLQPAEAGVISIAARARAIVASLPPRAAAAARWLEDARTVRASGDVSAIEAKLEIEVVFQHAERAQRAANGVALFARLVAKANDNLRQALETLHIEAVDATLVIRGQLPLSLVGELSRTRAADDHRM